jgi:hypothetical protein
MKLFITLLITITTSLSSRAHTPEIHTINTVVAVTDPSRLVSFNASLSNNRVILNWVIAENKAADKFEIEKSTDGKNFSMAALIFGTEEIDTANYQFYEKATGKKIYYRLKVIDKNNTVSYSNVLTIESGH